MRLKFRGIITALLLAFLGLPLRAAPVQVEGHFDLNYTYNFNSPPTVTSPSDTSLPAGNNKYRVFDLYHNNVNLNLAEVALVASEGKNSARLGFGAGTSVAVMNQKDGATGMITEAVLTHAFSPQWKLSAGKMLSHLGFELFRSSANWNYSRSALFGFALPFWHTGVALNYDSGGPWAGGLFLYDENSGLYEQNRGKSFGAQGRFGPVTYNGLSGVETDSTGASHVRTLHELIWSQSIFENLEVGIDSVYGQLTHAKLSGKNAEWWAVTAALKWTFKDFYLSPRFEIYTDRSGASVEGISPLWPSLPQRIESWTLTLGTKIKDGFRLRSEVRRDHSSSPQFYKGDSTSDSQTTLSLAVLYDYF